MTFYEGSPERGAPTGGGRSPVRVVAAAAAAVLLSASIAACGGSSRSSSASSSGAGTTAASGSATSGSSAVAAAKAIVAKYQGVSNTFVAPGPAINVKSLKGKQIWYIPVSAEVPILQINAAAIQQAAKAAGLSTRTCDGKGLPPDESACIQQAVNAGAAGIITDSIDPTTISTAVADATKHNIPIVSGNDVGNTTSELQYSTFGDVQVEPIAADWIIANSNGKANILAASVSGDPHGTQYAESKFVAELKKNCPGCTLNSVSESTPDLTQLPSAVSAALLQNSGVNYGFAQFDVLEPLFAKGVQQTGKKVTLVGTNSVLDDLKQMKSGDGQAVDLGQNRNYLGWQAVDRLLRMMLHKPAPTKQTVPIRIFDSANLGSIQLTNSAAESGSWWGPLTYREDFEKLWGLS